MAKPRVFISSTYSDLKDIRLQISKFVTEYGFMPVTFEKNDIPYDLTKKLEESCYDEIKDVSFMILIIKEKYGTFSTSTISDGLINSVTQLEYNVAKKVGIPIFVFIHQSSYDEYNNYTKSDMGENYKFSYIENIHLAKFIDTIFEDKAFRYMFRYNDFDDIQDTLKKQWAGLFFKYFENVKKFEQRKSEFIPVNSFKFFYFRRNKGLSQAQLAAKSEVSETKIQKVEDAGVKKNHIEIHDFESMTLDELQRVANVLQCSVGNLKAGLPDDFLSQYLLYYFKNKGTQQRRKSFENSGNLFKTKAVIFDFDGTLTQPIDNHTTWEKIWIELGYDINDCAELHRKYSISEITHKEWCELTESKFKSKGLSKQHLNKIADDLHLVNGIESVIKELSENNISLYICSGSIDYIVKRALRESGRNFEEIKSNKFLFDRNDKLHSIIGTRYDFEGKADYISQISRDLDIHPYEILFVGNSLNDEWAHQSGAITLCINPTMTNPDHPFQWTYSIRNLKNLNEILRFVTM
ncbi:HAD-IB family phosphatase [Taibaiella lutea]|uniref:phosphoserine phosphatase n=1 Tax=Taibaiella lutea TaxID=2608001 RepID=A0A5M6CIU2_9BACT|nr:HAD-IB family phosphatase [Taibaiella lutea]KAA5535121.1 HAD-IB family phosphatase [Taibaiella lutea]